MNPFQTSNLSEVWGWVGASATLTSVIGGLLTFIRWNRRKANLEIRKLEIEIQNMRRQQSIIYRPTLIEIREILEETRPIAIRRLGVIGGGDALDEFGAQLHHFLTVVMAYCGDTEARLRITEQRFAATIQNWPDPYPDYSEADSDRPYRLPDVTRIYELWEATKPMARQKLSQETWERINSLLRLLMKGAHDAA